MAQRIKQIGGSIPTIIFIGTYCPDLSRGRVNSETELLGFLFALNIIEMYCRIRRLDLNEDQLIESVSTLTQKQRYDIILEAGEMAGVYDSTVTLDEVIRSYDVAREVVKSQDDYIPKIYDGKIIILKAENNKKLEEVGFLPNVENNLYLGWDAFCPNIDVHIVPGDHFSMLQPPNAEILFKKILEILDDKRK